jgi:hypothetical protein
MSDLQFGFKKGLSSCVCTMVIKETIAYYNSNEGHVYCVTLDATKAFDRVNYAKLFPKLFERKIPFIVIRYLFEHKQLSIWQLISVIQKLITQTQFRKYATD